MIRNYLKTAWRSLWKNKTASFINLLGLSVGMTCCLLMVLYMQHELSYDKFQENGDRTVRVIMEYSFGNAPKSTGNYTSTKVFPAFKRSFPEVTDGVRMAGGTRLVKYKGEMFNEPKFLHADSTFFNVFRSFPLLIGKPDQVLKNPNNVVLSETMAKKYFGSIDNAVGKVLQVNSREDNYLVTGVTRDCPSNSQIKFNFLASFSSFGPAQEETYWDANYTTYLLLKDKASIRSLQSKIEPFMKKEIKAQGDENAYVNFLLEPYTKVHLYSQHDGFEPNSNITYIYIIAAIALLILMIACFTYINLSTSRSMERAREVGIRKVAGAFRSQVFWQFISESLMMTVLALLLSIGMVAVLLPAFNQLAERALTIQQLGSTAVVLVSVLIVIVISLLAGSYPAVILSRFQPVRVLKGAFKNTGSGVLLRKSLIVFQFMISVFLIVSTFIIQRQLSFIQHKKLGYDREHVITMLADQKVIDKIELVKSELKSSPDILAVSKAYNTPVNIQGGYSMYRADQGASQSVNTNGNPIDDEYVQATGLELIAGSNLSRQDILDASKEDYEKNYYHYLINEKACKILGWKPEEAIGKKIFLGEQRPGEIKGVVRDFHFASLHSEVQPLVLFPGGWGSTIIVKTNGKNLASVISFLESKWKVFAAHRPFEYQFMDEQFQQLYASEMRTGKVFSIFSGIAILLACLGLFGLSAYEAQQRIKEIGVRKVLGATGAQIVILLSSAFLKLVLIAFVIIAPLCWYFMNQWLADFAYRITISWWIFAIAAIIVLAIALLTVSIQSLRAAFANPVKSLRSE